VTGVDDPRLTAEEMDIQRQENIAYEYLCHLEEAKVYVSFAVLQFAVRDGMRDSQCGSMEIWGNTDNWWKSLGF